MIHNIKSFKDKGFCIINLFSKNEVNEIKKILIKRINKISKNFLLLNSDQLENLHNINLSASNYKKIVKGSNRYLQFNNDMIKKINSNTFIKNITKYLWGHNKFNIMWDKDYKKFKKNSTGYRIARPYKIFKTDVGGAHCDLVFTKNFSDSFKSLLTIWCPLFGFDKKHVLRLAEGSHKYSHPENVIVRKKYFSSPVLEKKYANSFKYVRPQLKVGQAIIFHPNLIHGGSINFGKQTRVSIDFRIFNKKVFKKLKNSIILNSKFYSYS